MSRHLKTHAVVHGGGVRLYRATSPEAVRPRAAISPGTEVVPVGEPVLLAEGTTTLDIKLLGGFAVTVDGRRVGPEAFDARRAADLVKVLALAPGHQGGPPRPPRTDVSPGTCVTCRGIAVAGRSSHRNGRTVLRVTGASVSGAAFCRVGH